MGDISCWHVLPIWLLRTKVTTLRFSCASNLKAMIFMDRMSLMASLLSYRSLYAARLHSSALRALVHFIITRTYNFPMLISS